MEKGNHYKNDEGGLMNQFFLINWRRKLMRGHIDVVVALGSGPAEKWPGKKWQITKSNRGVKKRAMEKKREAYKKACTTKQTSDEKKNKWIKKQEAL